MPGAFFFLPDRYCYPMKALMLFTLAVLLAAPGCDRKSKPASGTDTNGISGNPIDAPADYLRAVTKGQQVAVKTVDTAAITRAIQMFNVEEGRNPKDLNELVEKKYMPRLPEAPAGMKIAYDAQAGTVKIVPQ